MSHSKKNITLGEPSLRPPDLQRKKLGQILLDAGYIEPENLTKALALQNLENASLGEILVLNNQLTPANLAHALSDQSNIEFDSIPNWDEIDCARFPISPDVMIAYDFVPTSFDGTVAGIAFSDPQKLDAIKTVLREAGIQPQFRMAHRSKIRTHISTIAKGFLTEGAEKFCPDQFACRAQLQTVQRPLGFVLICLALLAVIFPQFAIQTFIVFALAISFSNIALKAALLATSYSKPKKEPPSNVVPLKKLERVSIFVPLFKEDEIVPRLVSRLSNLDYPKELLEVFIICEANDTRTMESLARLNLPDNFIVMKLDTGQIQTKPRAMNYALKFATGSIIGVYDAEDAPEISQVYRAVKHLQKAEPHVACVQARLDFFNQNTNWLSRCFTIEYAVLFRVYLKGLHKLGLPILLGGTSMFIRRNVLEELGGWDAHNVTEDADLGIRLYRKGYRVEPLDSTTYEEANYLLFPWVKQRSRWLKGFFWTWITSMKQPVSLFKELGPISFLSLQAQLFSAFATYIVLPFILPFWLLSLGFSYGPNLFWLIFPIFLALLLIGEPIQIFAYFKALKNEKHRPLRKWIPMMFLYWPLASLAAYKAFWEVMVAPTYWDKTKHGLNDAEFGDEIKALTTR